MRNANNGITRADGVENFRRGRKQGHDAHQGECSPGSGAAQSVEYPARLGADTRAAALFLTRGLSFKSVGCRICCMQIVRGFILFGAGEGSAG